VADVVLPTDSNFAEAHISTITSETAFSSEDTAPSLLIPSLAPSNQSPIGDHNIVPSPNFLPGAWDLLIPSNPLLLGHLQIWEQPVSLFGEGIDSGTFTIQNYGLGVGVTQSQLAPSHLCLPQINWDPSQEPPLPYNNQATIPVSIIMSPHSAQRKLGSIRVDYLLIPSFQACFSVGHPTEILQAGGSTSTERAPESDILHDAPFNALFRTIRPPATSRALPSQPPLPRGTPAPDDRSYDRPGKKRASHFQPDPFKLQESCRRAGGSTFAVDWIISTFKYGVTIEALLRVLERKEIDEMNFPGGFEPHQAYDGFISKVGRRYECGLCNESNRTRWKNKKDAPRHLRKFHFGLADVCKDWSLVSQTRANFFFFWLGVPDHILISISSGKDMFNKAEMKTHRCVRRAEDYS